MRSYIDVLKETRLDEFSLMLPRVDVRKLAQQKELNPQIWREDETLDPTVRDQLTKTIDDFLDHAGIDHDSLRDVVICGSNANFSYTDHSNIDIHIELPEVTDSENEAVLSFNKQSREVNGIPIEIAIESRETSASRSGGIYSLMTDEWLVAPEKVAGEHIDDTTQTLVNRRSQEIIQQIKGVIATQDAGKIKELVAKFRAQYQSTVSGNHLGGAPGELQVEALAIKAVVGLGWATKLDQALEHASTLPPRAERPSLRDYLPGAGAPPKNYAYNDELDPLIWNPDETMKPAVYQKLMLIANAFIKYIKIPIPVYDIVLRGSLANFNYNATSDLDIHIITKKLDPKDADFITTKRILWKQKYDNIRILGRPVEMMVEEPDAVHTSAGNFSLKKNEWLTRPPHAVPEVDWKAVNRQARVWFDDLTAAIKSGDINTMNVEKNKIYTIRRGTLDGTPGTEYSVANLAFKKIRNTGIIDRMNKIIDDDRQKNLSLPK